MINKIINKIINKKTELKALFVSIELVLIMIIEGELIHLMWPKFPIEAIIFGVPSQLIIFFYLKNKDIFEVISNETTICFPRKEVIIIGYNSTNEENEKYEVIIKFKNPECMITLEYNNKLEQEVMYNYLTTRIFGKNKERL